MKQLATYISEKLKITKDNLIKDNNKYLNLDIKYLNDLNSDNKEDDWKARKEIIDSIQEWMDQEDFIKVCFPKKKLRYEIVIDNKWSLWLTHDESYKGDDVSLISIYLVLKTSNKKCFKYDYFGGLHIKDDNIKGYENYIDNFTRYNNAWNPFRHNYDETNSGFREVPSSDNIETYSWKIETMI